MDAVVNETAIDEQTLSEIESDASGFNDAGQGEGDKSECLEPEIPTKELIQPIVNFATAVMAPNWEIQAEENEMLADAYSSLLDKYFPNAMGNFGVELNALLITAAVLTPRLGKPRFVEAANDEKAVNENETVNENKPKTTGRKLPDELAMLETEQTVNGEKVA
ncbi:hypothetical protein CYQ88_10855 [Hydrogenovibrio sp. SC-1]|uniref:hypothetical protein n=1 Tax=Hydrogenovibrio sp. SC-1 TaxID=2065820 RepID=UPI000C7C8A46|nr:hypothetical protein [Hydrogenovibrio sp. SC-1]PLA73514.1 hypothetical protein CYQ88_10855 [Hydrogenovibrio sp. SC-1]